MPYSSYLKNKLLDTLRHVAFDVTSVYVSLHTANPGDTGVNEVSGGSPAYARKLIAWNAASAGVLDDSSNGLIFDVPAGTTIAYVGFWDALTTGNFLASQPVTNETYAAQGQYTATDVKLDLNS